MAPPKFFRRRGALSRGRTETIRKLIEAHVARTGLVPTDEQITSQCAISAERVRRHRDALGRGWR